VCRARLRRCKLPRTGSLATGVRQGRPDRSTQLVSSLQPPSPPQAQQGLHAAGWSRQVGVACAKGLWRPGGRTRKMTFPERREPHKGRQLVRAHAMSSHHRWDVRREGPIASTPSCWPPSRRSASRATASLCTAVDPFQCLHRRRVIEGREAAPTLPASRPSASRVARPQRARPRSPPRSTCPTDPAAPRPPLPTPACS
jgi:hypothetical protein